MNPMDGDQRYSAERWEETRQEARAAEPPPRPASDSHSPATLVPGIVRMSLRGDDEDTLAIVAALRGRGFKVWVGDSPGTKGGNEAGFRYFTVKVRDDRDG